MHQMICPAPKGKEVHHKDNDGWNNQRLNLEPLTRKAHSQLLRRKRRGKCSSKYVGVHWHAQHGKWCAELGNAGNKKHLGLFSSELAAYKAYRKAKNEVK